MDFIRKMLLRPFGSGLQVGSADHRIPIEVLQGSDMQMTLAKWVAGLNRDRYETVVVIAPVANPPVAWPAALRLIRTSSDELSVPDACLCCAMSTEVNEALSQLFFSVLRKQQPAVRLVVLATSAESAAPLAAALKHAPFLGQRYRLVAPTQASQ